MTKIDKFKKLEEAKRELKRQFIGLDDIIDQIINSITPWYITQEILERPTVISLWGMTGTGKTSVIKKLITLLELNEKTISFDCGRESEGNTYGETLSDKISEIMGTNDDRNEINSARDFIFIFDEFQYARTIDEDCNELTKSSLRPIWNIIDDGYVPIYENRYSVNIFLDFLEDAFAFEKENPDIIIHIENGKITNPDEIDIISKSQLGMFHFNNSEYGCLQEETSEEIIPKEYDLSRIFTTHICKKICKKLNNKEAGLGKTVINNIKNVKTLKDLLRILDSIKKDILSPKILDCSKSLVFIIGNLDEAFKVQNELDHDGDADTFREITDGVSITDIKFALKKRFRAEQISRLGNNLIKYPTLNKKHFEKIIEKELIRLKTEFFDKTGISISYCPGINELLYSEGVCPVQGVRPVFTTIGMLITPILSDILIKSEELNTKEATIGLKNMDDWKEKCFKLPKVYLEVKFIRTEDKKPIYTIFPEIKLQVGELRSPENRKTRYVSGIHEAGHAIAMISCTGDYPVQVVAVDTNNGGTCYSFQKERHNEIPSRRDFENDMLISLGGYLAEEVVFSDPSMRLMGSNSDIQSCWEKLTEAILIGGYLEPTLFINPRVQTEPTGIPGGFDMETYKVIYKGKSTTIVNVMSQIFLEYKDKLFNLMKREIILLAKLGKYLGEKGSMNKSTLIEYVDKYGTEQLKYEIKKSKEETSYDRYYNYIIDILKEE